MPHPELKGKVNFNRKAINASTPRLSFYKARRYRGPLYDAIVKELYEEGCSIAAKHVECLAKKEEELMNSSTIGVPLRSDVELLSALIHNVEFAEKAYYVKDCGGMAATFRLLYQCLLLLEPHNDTFNWLLCDVYVIISKICDSVKQPNDSTAEMIARIYYKHAIYLSAKSSDWPRAIKYLEKALAITRSNMWFANENNQDNAVSIKTLHEAEAQYLSNLLLKYAAEVKHINPAESAELAQKAIFVIAECLDSNKVSFYEATIARASYLIASENHVAAIKLLESIYEEVKIQWDDKLKILHCQCAMYMAICYSTSDCDKMATEKFREAVLLSRRFESPLLEAKVLVSMGRHLLKTPTKCSLAKEAFKTARKIYAKNGDRKSVAQISYLISNLQSHEIMPFLITMMKNSEEQYCEYANLNVWKSQVRPFWPTIQQDVENQENDEIYCLLIARSAIQTTGIKNPPQPTKRKSDKI